MTDRTDVIVVGRGAIGSLLAARLARAGLSVRQVSGGLSPGRRRLSVREPGGAWQVRVEAATWIEAPQARIARLVILALKTPQLAPYLERLKSVAFPAASIVSVHNGLPDLPAEAPAVIPAVVQATADCDGETVVCHAFDSVLVARDALPSSAAELRPRLEDAGFRFVPDRKLETERWLKLAVVTTGARMVLANASIGAATRDPALRRDLAAVVEESGAVIAAGLPAASRDHFLERCRDLEGWFRDGTLIDPRTAPMTEAYPSLHRDLERGRPTEIDSLNGAVVRRAARLGVEAPLNRLLTAEIVALASRAMTPAEAARTPELQRRLRNAFAELAA